MSNLEKVVGIIPARLNSKRLVNKNFRNFRGKPLYAHTTDLASKILPLSILSTDNKDLKQSALPSNIVIDERKESLCQDTTSINEVIKYIIEEYELRHKDIMLLQPTSPLRKASDILNSYNMFKSNYCSQVISISKADQSILKHGFLENNKFVPISSSSFLNMNDQELPDIYRPNGAIYIFKADEFIKCGNKLPNSNLLGYLMPKSHSIDINTMTDMVEAEKYYKD